MTAKWRSHQWMILRWLPSENLGSLNHRKEATKTMKVFTCWVKTPKKHQLLNHQPISPWMRVSKNASCKWIAFWVKTLGKAFNFHLDLLKVVGKKFSKYSPNGGCSWWFTMGSNPQKNHWKNKSEFLGSGFKFLGLGFPPKKVGTVGWKSRFHHSEGETVLKSVVKDWPIFWGESLKINRGSIFWFLWKWCMYYVLLEKNMYLQIDFHSTQNDIMLFSWLFCNS